MASSRAIVSPSPTPSAMRVLPACWKGWNTRASSAASMPGPVSRTLMRMPPRIGRGATASVTLPRTVNFTALPSRFCSTWRTRAASPRTQHGRGRALCSVNCRPLSAARSAVTSASWSSSAARSKSAACSTKAPASMTEASSRSLIRPCRCRPELSISSSRRSAAGSRDSRCISRASPRMPCSGVRSSWLTLARKRSRSALRSRASCSAASFSATNWSACWRSSRPMARRCEVARAVASSSASSSSWPPAAKWAMSSLRTARPQAMGSSIGTT